MIECVAENVWYKRKPIKKSFWVFFFIILLVSLLVTYYNFVIKKVIYSYCEQSLYSTNVTSINKAVNLTLTDKSYYEDLIKINKDSQGNVVLMTVDSFKVNKISREVEKLSNDFLQNDVKKGVEIPFLAFLGLDFLSGYGKSVQFNNLTLSNVKCDFESIFENVGINQTLHSIYINVNCEILISIPFGNQQKSFTSKILIGETVIMGKIPDIYLNGKLFS